MKISIKRSVDLTPSLETYIESKLVPLAKFVKPFDATGEAAIWLEISRTSKHHKKGSVFFASIDLRLPKKILRAEAYAENVRRAIDEARDTLRLEIQKYKTQFAKVTRGKEK